MGAHFALSDRTSVAASFSHGWGHLLVMRTQGVLAHQAVHGTALMGAVVFCFYQNARPNAAPYFWPRYGNRRSFELTGAVN
jgi:hypothetical protein